LRRIRDFSDEESWNQFCVLYVPYLDRLLSRIGFERADVLDATQETLATVMAHIGDFHYDRGGKFRNWLATIAVRNAYRIRRQSHDAMNSPGGTENLAALHELACQRTHEAWFEARIEYALRQLEKRANPGDWQAFKQAVLDARSSQEVADSLGINLGSLYVRKARAKRLLLEIVCEIDE